MSTMEHITISNLLLYSELPQRCPDPIISVPIPLLRLFRLDFDSEYFETTHPFQELVSDFSPETLHLYGEDENKNFIPSPR